ncbi:MAG: aminotransferase class III-fold pyridoxal phosphate-dependent enzyme, partial [Rhodothermales bacterium]|nr:aminotransferase class III-fold pyridoxal phosphate-dependent enzyme [Rhodothermales bacterium]
MPSDLEHAFTRHLAWTSDSPIGLEVASADGPFIHLADGRRIVDLISGIAVSSVGHRHPRVVEAVRQQIDRHLHVMVYGE